MPTKPDTKTAHTPGRGFKADGAAHEALGDIYGAVPKSAFALIAYHLANLCADDPDQHNSILARLQVEADALVANGIMPERHADQLRTAIARAEGSAK